MLATRGAWPTFGVAFFIVLIAILPVLRISEPQVAPKGPPVA